MNNTKSFEQDYRLFNIDGVDEFEIPIYDIEKPFKQCTILKETPTSYSSTTTMYERPHE